MRILCFSTKNNAIDVLGLAVNFQPVKTLSCCVMEVGVCLRRRCVMDGIIVLIKLMKQTAQVLNLTDGVSICLVNNDFSQTNISICR